MEDKKETKIVVAEVINTLDLTQNGQFLARVGSDSNAEVVVNYTSPYASNSQGAFVAIPEMSAEILICQPEGSTGWYYIGATFTPESKEATGPQVKTPKPLKRAAPLTYRARGIPMAMSWTGPQGGGLKISEEYTPKFFNNKIELKSSIGKKVMLSDAPGQDYILLDSGNGASIALTDTPQNQMFPARSIQVKSIGPQKYINTESQTDIIVVDGRELQVLNNSTGSNAPEDEPDLAGNVNIQSKWKDVNVFTQAEKGRIFIECLNTDGADQVIEIQTHGSNGAIRIKTNGKVDIHAKDIGVEATGDINVKAAGAINMEAGASINLKSSSNINADGQEVHLNGGQARNATPSIGDAESYYGNEGVTTY